jgi:hypothetical protein
MTVALLFTGINQFLSRFLAKWKAVTPFRAWGEIFASRECLVQRAAENAGR